MLRPSPSELLAGVADALDQTVLPALDRGPARNQVQAAIGIVRRCAAAMDTLGPVLHAECTDLVSTLQHLASADAGLLPDHASFELAADRAAAVLASTYPSLGELTEAVALLQEQAAAMAVAAEQQASPQLPEIRRLLQRMLEREQALRLSPW